MADKIAEARVLAKVMVRTLLTVSYINMQLCILKSLFYISNQSVRIMKLVNFEPEIDTKMAYNERACLKTSF